jgi:flagella basal body P-ring formation protein FlgA
MRQILLTAGFFFLLAQAAVPETLEEYLSDKIIADYQLAPENVEITIVRSALDHTEIDGFEIEAYPMTGARPKGRFPMHVELSHDGAIVDKGSVSLDVRVFDEVPVPVQNIRRHEMLSAEMFTSERIDITNISEELLSEESQYEGCRAKHNLAAGRYVPLRRVEKLPDVENGCHVTIVGKGSLFEIRAKGMALQSGVIGETIKVKNIDSKKILLGEITGPGVVEITI